METCIEGVVAAGYVRGGSTKQVASAVGEGAIAALMIRNYLEKQLGNRRYKGDYYHSASESIAELDNRPKKSIRARQRRALML